MSRSMSQRTQWRSTSVMQNCGRSPWLTPVRIPRRRQIEENCRVFAQRRDLLLYVRRWTLQRKHFSINRIPRATSKTCYCRGCKSTGALGALTRDESRVIDFAEKPTGAGAINGGCSFSILGIELNWRRTMMLGKTPLSGV